MAKKNAKNKVSFVSQNSFATTLILMGCLNGLVAHEDCENVRKTGKSFGFIQLIFHAI